MKTKSSPVYIKFLVPIGIANLIFITYTSLIFLFFKDSTSLFLPLFILGCIGIMSFIAFYANKNIKKPIELMTEAIDTNNLNLLSNIKATENLDKIAAFLYSIHSQKEELKKAKEKAEEGEVLKSSFLTNLSHEIRTPMNAILGFSDLISTQKLSEVEKKEYLSIIKRSGKNLVCIIDDLIEMSKIDTNQVKPNYSAFNLDEVLNNIQQTVAITIPKEKPLTVILDKPKYPVVFQLISDETKLRQVIVNLVNNAVKYTEKGTVNFGYKINADANALELYITDTGIGISKTEFDNIFSRFNRIQNDKTMNLSGLGLGLAISKAYITMLGGKIWLKSTENVGTTFSFTIPLKLNGLPAKQIEEISLNPIDKVKPLTILIAEDDAVNFMLLKRVMDIRKYTVVRAINGEQAVDICKNNDNIQLVIMDIKMPRMDGFQARKAIKEFKPYLPIIAHTAHTSAEINGRVYDAGFIDCISKPLNKTKLFRIIDRIEHLTPDPIIS